ILSFAQHLPDRGRPRPPRSWNSRRRVREFPLALSPGESLASPHMLANLLFALKLVCRGEFMRVWREVHVRIYRPLWEFLFVFIRPFRVAGRPEPRGTFSRETKFPVAFESPDHLAPKGTAVNNSTNKKFVLHLDARIHRDFGNATCRMMDL